MATTAQSAYCFEVLAAALEKRPALSLRQVEELWTKYQRHLNGEDDMSEAGDISEDAEVTEGDDTESSGLDPKTALKPRNVQRLQEKSPGASASSSSTPSTVASAASSSTGLASPASKSSSKSSLFSFIRNKDTKGEKVEELSESELDEEEEEEKEEEYPVFVTWNTLSSRGHKSLRGCIGTFEAGPLSYNLREYAITSALHDTRFSPITLSELPTLHNSITLLLNFTPCADPLDWNIGEHGLRISFTHHARRYGATYLPDVAREQGWSKEETIVSLMKKAGWHGRSSEWRKVGDLKATRYEGKVASIGYSAWREWRDWVGRREVEKR